MYLNFKRKTQEKKERKKRRKTKKAIKKKERKEGFLTASKRNRKDPGTAESRLALPCPTFAKRFIVFSVTATRRSLRALCDVLERCK